MPKVIKEGVCPECGADDPKKIVDTHHHDILACITCGVNFRPHFEEVFDGHQIWENKSGSAFDWEMVKLLPATPQTLKPPVDEQGGEVSRLLLEAVQHACTCGGSGPLDKECCPACKVYHHVLGNDNPQPEQRVTSGRIAKM